MGVRRATRSDIERLVDLNVEVHDLHVAHRPDFFKPGPREYLAAYFEEMLETPAARIFVTYEGPAIVGYVLLVIRERLETPLTHAQRWVYIQEIGVTEAHRGRGHATALIEATRAAAKEEGIDLIELDTWSFNERAQRFFRSVGFHTRMIRMEM